MEHHKRRQRPEQGCAHPATNRCVCLVRVAIKTDDGANYRKLKRLYTDRRVRTGKFDGVTRFSLQLHRLLSILTNHLSQKKGKE